MTWLEPLWLAYPAAALSLVLLALAVSARWWLREHQPLPTNYRLNEMSWGPRDWGPRDWGPRNFAATNHHQVFAVSSMPAAVFPAFGVTSHRVP